MGVNDDGSLHVLGGPPSITGNTDVGARYIKPGVGQIEYIYAEGWGVADPVTGVTGYCKSGSNTGLTMISFTSTATEATSIVETSAVGPVKFRVTHHYYPSPVASVYQIDATIQNIGTASVMDLRYRRVMDMDVEPTEMYEYTTIQGWPNLMLLHSCDNGFSSCNPLVPQSPLDPFTVDRNYTHYGPYDQGMVFDFGFGNLPPGGLRRFTIFYGGADTVAQADGFISTLGAEIYSYGEPDLPEADPEYSVAIFAFRGIGNTPVADAGPDQTVPVGPVTLDGSGSYDPQSLPLTYAWTEGAVVIATGVNPTVPMAHGDHTITLTVTNSELLSDSDDTHVLVDRAPVAFDQYVYAYVGQPKAITLVATDPDADPLTYQIVTSPAHGVLSGTPPNVVYTSAPGYIGDDSFTFMANDGWLDSNIATVDIDVGLAINCGGPTVGDWKKDQYFAGGRAIWSSATVTNAGAVPTSVYRAQRTGIFSYNIPAANGLYDVRLHFAELAFPRAGMRTFDVYIEGRRVLSRFDVFAAAGGRRKAVTRVFAVSVSDGNGLQIRFVPRKLNAIVSGIEVD